MGLSKKPECELWAAECQKSILETCETPKELPKRDFNAEAKGKTHSQSYSAVAGGLATSAGMIINFTEMDEAKLAKVAATIDHVANAVASAEVKRLFGDK